MIVIRKLLILTVIFIANIALGQLVSTPNLNKNTELQPTCSTEIKQEYIDFLSGTRDVRNEVKEDLRNGSFRLPNPTLEIVAHILVEDETNLEGVFSESQVDESLDQLNTAFDQVGLLFERCLNVNYITEDQENPDLDITNINSFEMAERLAIQNNVENAINVYYANKLLGGFSCGWGTYPVAEIQYIIMQTATELDQHPGIDITPCPLNGATFPHEMGHYFNLLHTWERKKTAPEFVDESNCGSGVGDEICDTPADPHGLPTNVTYLEDGSVVKYNIAKCSTYPESTILPPCVLDFTKQTDLTSTGDWGCQLEDENGDVYMPNPKNIMSYGGWKACKTYFSPQQIERMLISLVVFDPELLASECRENCESDKNLGNTYIHSDTGLDVFNVSEDITSGAKVLATGYTNAKTIYNAGESVCLNPSFEAEYGSTFLAFIHGCESPSPNFKIDGAKKNNTTSSNFEIHPNPASSKAIIEYQLKSDSNVSFSLFSITGKQISTLLQNEQKFTGLHQLNFDISGLPTGIYYCTMHANEHIETQRIVITK